MNIRQSIEKLLDKWPAKVICLMLAIFLYIFHQVSLVEKKVIIVPLEIVENGNVMSVGEIPKNVSVIVRAQSDVINTISASDLSARINLNAIVESGTIDVPVTVTVAEKLLVYDPLEVKVRPETITIDVEKKIAKYVQIIPSISGEVAEGYMIQSVAMNPSSVEIIGPASIVNATDSIFTTGLIVNNAEKNFTDEVNYLEINNLIVVNNQGPYKATVTVEPQPMTKEYSGVHIVPRDLAENLEIETEIPDIDFVLGGTVPVLTKYILGANVVQIDLSQITEPGSYDIPVKFVLPSSLNLESKSFEHVNLIVVERKVKTVEEVVEEPEVTQ